MLHGRVATILVSIEADTASETVGGLGLYARASCHGRENDLRRQVARVLSADGGCSVRNRARRALGAAGYG